MLKTITALQWTTALSGALAFALPAYAQAPTTGLREIVVTAQKREQSLQDVPTSVTAITADSLEINRISNITDLDSVTPNLTITNVPAGNSSPTYSMRGVIGLGTAPGADKGVALYIDGVYIGSGSGSNFDLAEIERVEVLKGPQGTLFGRNSTGGAISITTRGPRGEWNFKQKFTYGNYDQIRSITRIDTGTYGPFSAAVTYAHSERRGEIRNLGAGTVWDARGSDLGILKAVDYLGSDNTESVAASLRAELTPDFDITYKFDWTEGNFNEQGVGQLAWLPSVAPGFLPSTEELNAASGFPLFLSQTRPKALNNWATVPSKIKASGHVLIANWQVNDSLRVKNTVAYRKSSYYGPLNQLYGAGGLLIAPGVPWFTVVTLSGGKDSQWTEELQVDYDTSLLHVTAGAFYFDQHNEKGQPGTGYNSINFSPAPGFVVPTPPDAPRLRSTVDVRSYAVYAQAEVHVMDTLDLVGGARYTDDKKRGIDRTIPTVGDLNYDGNNWTYNLGVNFKPTNDILLYGKYATGYISGGKLATLDYGVETAKSWEAGVKADWFDNRVRTNLSLFTVKYSNLQFAASGILFDVPAAAQVLVNAGDARAKGFELEMTALPIPSVTLGANVGYLDFKLTRLDPRYEAAGNTIATQRPKWTVNLSAQYETPPIIGDAQLRIRADANYRAEHDGSANPNYREVARIPASWIVNGAITLDDLELGSGLHTTLALWARNLFDEDTPRYILGAPVGMATVYERARTYGVDATFEF